MTNYQNIYERFQIKVQDYTLDKLYSASLYDYEAYLKALLKSAIVKFNKCVVSLSDRDDDAQIFNVTLSDEEEEILALLMTLEWCDKEVKNIHDIRLGLNDTDFKRYAEGQNLKEKINLRNSTKEDVDKLIVSYTYSNTDFSQI